MELGSSAQLGLMGLLILRSAPFIHTPPTLTTSPSLLKEAPSSGTLTSHGCVLLSMAPSSSDQSMAMAILSSDPPMNSPSFLVVGYLSLWFG